MIFQNEQGNYSRRIRRRRDANPPIYYVIDTEGNPVYTKEGDLIIIENAMSNTLIIDACASIGIYPPSIILNATLNGDETGEIENTFAGSTFTPELTHAPETVLAFYNNAPVEGLQWSYVENGANYDVVIIGLTEKLENVKITAR